ncbi:hypothetical protein [Pseudomonas graminis]|uniref:Uncharacterized protein n=1 Tax=Pseudomonas graminis TaxID=158627 RepID=A0A1C2DR79_9PSED|nr:hypothetical protein [Pseudomonas graminis]OCX17288.1 hypothetical protein BBI10_17360 [Pseudomonas graminis]RYE71800.1 MAG: hypothetical protein EOO81_05040 [Oxalobacteraceae bacterium]
MSWDCISAWIEHHPGLASWVQALGSIAALGLAVWIPASQRRYEFRRNAAQERDRSVGYATRLFLMIKELETAILAINDRYQLGTSSVDLQIAVVLERLLDRFHDGFRDDLDAERIILTMDFRSLLTDLITVLRADLGFPGKDHRDGQVSEFKQLFEPMLDNAAALLVAAKEAQQTTH